MKISSAAAAILLICSLQLDGQVPAGSVRYSIPSLTEPAESLTIRDLSVQTGYATFASGSRLGVLLPAAAGVSAEERAMSFVDSYGAPFGLRDSSQVRVVREPDVDELGVEHVRMQQFHNGIPVTAGDFVVHLKGARVIAANGHVIGDFPDSTVPAFAPETAQEHARQLIAKHKADHAADAQYSEPRLEIFNRGLFSDGFNDRSRLAWFVEVTGFALREFIWIDAQTGAILLNFSQLAEAKNRLIYNGNHTSSLPGTLMRSEGGAATGDADADNAYTYAGITYDYFLNNHGRDSFNSTGGAIISTVHHCGSGYPQGTTCPDYQNAAWTGSQMLYADGFSAADDVVAHELTHAVTDYSANLFYYMQSGALNESYSDIFGETVDLLDGLGNDASNVRWRAGEDLAIGAIRDMMTPTLYGDPGKMSDSTYFYCGFGDNGGVHINSGIPNHAYALMVDGGTYNNTTITGIGLTKAAKIQYRALTLYLTSGATFVDNFNSLNQSCTDLIGTVGITSADCVEVAKALQAVEMRNTWACDNTVQAPPLCSAGIPSFTFLDTFEVATSNWVATNTAAGGWGSQTSGFAKGGVYSAYGTDPSAVSDHRLSLNLNVTIPAGARLYFDHAYDFEAGNYDGGVLEYSTNSGANWSDAASLIDAGRGYTGTISNSFSNPLAGRSAFVNRSYGYTGTRLNLASLAGQNVRFRFRLGADSSFGSLGWLVDNFGIYTCSAVSTGILTVVDGVSNVGTVNVATEASAVIGNAGTVLTDVARTSSGAMWAIDGTNLYSINPINGARTLVGPLGNGSGGMNALVGHGSGLLAASYATTSIYSVNPATGAATALSGSLGLPSMGDLAFHGGSLYAAVQNGTFTDLVRVTLSGNSFTSTNLGHVTNDNALFGLAVGSDKNLYGFTGKKVLRINTSTPSASIVVVPNYTGSVLGNAAGASSPAPAPFTNDPIIAGATLVRAVHITELRARINAIRVARGLGAFSFSDPSLSLGFAPFRAFHVTELRTALSQAYLAAGLSSPAFTDLSILGLRPKALYINELRAAVIAME